MVLDDLKAMKLEELAETARAIVEEGQDDDGININSNELGAQRLKKLRIKSTKFRDKHQITKIKGFRKEISQLFR